MAIPTLEELAQYSVNRTGVEGIKQTLYDHLLYPQAGINQLNFFALPKGQGVTTALGAAVGAAKTQADTNMESAGQLPAGKSFLATSIEVMFYAGASAAANTYVQAAPGLFDAVAALAVVAAVNDVNAFYQSGSLRLFIGSKDYVNEGPLGRLPPKTHLGLNAGVASNSATTAEVGAVNAYAAGAPYVIDPPIYLENNQNFVVEMNWPGLVPMPSGFNGRVGVVLGGYTYRNSQ